MSEKELKNALRHEGEVRAREFWDQAEAAVEQRRQEINAELEHLRDETGRSLQAEAAALSNSLLFEARASATKQRLHAEFAMEMRLLEMADRVLREMAGDSRQKLWQALCHELPEYPWTNVKVHPEDLEFARRAFPAATIDGEEAMGGGLIATTAEGRVRIDNSLSCRLRRAWPELLPAIMKDLRKRVDSDATSRNDTTG